MSTVWKSDNLHSSIGFKVRHMMITHVNGNFSDFDAEVTSNENDFSAAHFNFHAAIESIQTGVADRDAHLKSPDFFNAETYPTMRFDSTSVEENGNGEFTIHGNLSIRDVTKPISLHAEHGGVVVDPYGQTKTGFSITGTIKRSEFGLTWSAVTEAGSIVVGDDIKLNGEIQFVKQS
jgi:polyisoprenoid-binding protein YceI